MNLRFDICNQQSELADPAARKSPQVVVGARMNLKSDICNLQSEMVARA
jgi:hypothetical protein